MLTLALLLAAVPAQDTLRYRFESLQEQDIDMSAMGAEGMQQSVEATGRLTFIRRDTVGGSAYTVRVDSATLSSSNPMVAGMMKLPSGLELTWAEIDGETRYPSEVDTTAALGMAMLTGVIRDLMLILPDSLDVGHSWSDTTTSADQPSAPPGITSRSVEHWRVAERLGEDLVLEATDSGTITMDVGPGTVSGILTGTRRVVLTPDGLPREASSDEGGDMQMLMDNMAMTIKQRTRTRLELLP